MGRPLSSEMATSYWYTTTSFFSDVLCSTKGVREWFGGFNDCRHGVWGVKWLLGGLVTESVGGIVGRVGVGGFWGGW